MKQSLDFNFWHLSYQSIKGVFDFFTDRLYKLIRCNNTIMYCYNWHVNNRFLIFYKISILPFCNRNWLWSILNNLSFNTGGKQLFQSTILCCRILLLEYPNYLILRNRKEIRRNRMNINESNPIHIYLKT